MWRGTDEDGNAVAVKVALPTARFRRLVVEEARSMRELAERVADAHRWFVPVLDEGVDDSGLPFYVMPFFAGTLAELLVADVPLLERLDVLVQACLAVELLHRTAPAERVVVHRDVKPSNFLVRRVGERWHVALSDFGIAREETFLERQTRTVMLTQSYAPPEQYLPLRAEPDPSMDVFALGAMVFEGVTCARTPRIAARAREWHNELADDMVRLMGSRNRLDAAGTERLEALRNRAAGAFLRSDMGEALPEDERRMVVEALRGALPEGSEALLLPALSRSLEPDPLSRLPSASSLRRACQELHDRLAAATGAPAWAPPVVPVFVPQGPSLGRERKGGDTWDGGTLAPGSTDGTDGTLSTGGRSGPPSRGREGVSPVWDALATMGPGTVDWDGGGPDTTGEAPRRTTGGPAGPSTTGGARPATGGQAGPPTGGARPATGGPAGPSTTGGARRTTGSQVGEAPQTGAPRTTGGQTGEVPAEVAREDVAEVVAPATPVPGAKAVRSGLLAITVGAGVVFAAFLLGARLDRAAPPVAVSPETPAAPIEAPPVEAPPVEHPPAEVKLLPPAPAARPAEVERPAPPVEPAAPKIEAAKEPAVKEPPAKEPPAKEPPPKEPDAPRRVVVALHVEGYSKMLHGWDGAEPTERGSSVRTFGVGSHVVELYHEGQVQRRVPVRVREEGEALVVDVGEGGSRATCAASGGRVGVVFDLRSGPRCR